jgi:DNA-binding response OmpR family regulator
MSAPATSEALRILLISTDEATRLQVSDAVRRVANGGSSGSPTDQAPARSEGLQPQIILLDDALGDMDPAWLVQRLASGAPDAAILALVGEGAIAAGAAGTPAGVQDVLHKPVSAAELIPAIGRVLVRTATVKRHQPSDGNVIAFCSTTEEPAARRQRSM